MVSLRTRWKDKTLRYYSVYIIRKINTEITSRSLVLTATAVNHTTSSRYQILTNSQNQNSLLEDNAISLSEIALNSTLSIFSKYFSDTFQKIL